MIKMELDRVFFSFLGSCPTIRNEDGCTGAVSLCLGQLIGWLDQGNVSGMPRPRHVPSVPRSSLVQFLKRLVKQKMTPCVRI